MDLIYFILNLIVRFLRWFRQVASRVADAAMTYGLPTNAGSNSTVGCIPVFQWGDPIAVYALMRARPRRELNTEFRIEGGSSFLRRCNQ